MSRHKKSKEEIKYLWQYKDDDITTWKYKDVIISGNKEEGKLYIKEWVKNPEFKYQHLCKD